MRFMSSVSSNNNETAENSFRGFGGEAIILAGGLGTRLRDTIPGLPKCMAPVAGRPFLTYIIRYLLSEGFEKFIFSLGYQHEMIEDFLNTNFPTIPVQFSIEEEPLGTGGAIRLACEKATQKNVLVLNGDTLFKVDTAGLEAFHYQRKAHCTLALKPMHNISRYGMVELNEDHSIKSFKEKEFYERGHINGGVYMLNVSSFLEQGLPAKFSFEKDYLEKSYNNKKIYGLIQNGYFIDIGTPEDYTRAQQELKQSPLDLSLINSHWTLFLDRDGVINQEKKDDYILNWREFQFYDGVKEAFQQFSHTFGNIFIVSNQRGVGKGLMTEADLSSIHQHMQKQIETAGGRVDKIYYCTSTDNKHPERKPNPGMAFRAKRDYPSIDLSKSIIIGNKGSDMLFGRNAGMHTAFVRTTNPYLPLPHPDIDIAFDSLSDFAKALHNSQNFTTLSSL
jgi:D-glycero-alpha-D-manno-heptose 1-phosphate guanylyltransferase